MNKNVLHKIFVAAMALGLVGAAAGCAHSSSTEPGSEAGRHGNTASGEMAWHSSKSGGFTFEKYTKADYELIIALNTDGISDMSVYDFNKKAMDWENEDAYHRTEEALTRLFSSLPETDPAADFVFTTMKNTWSECEKKHYNQCAKEQAPWYSATAAYEKRGDVYGESELLLGCYADLSFNYTFADESTLTIGQRDAALAQVEADLISYMEGQPVKTLENIEKMEEKLTGELESILKHMDERVVYGGECSVSYTYEAPYDSDLYDSEAGNAISGGAWQESGSGSGNGYTKAQYQQAVDALLPDGYEKMSVAEFNRMIHKTLAESDWEEDSIAYAYEMVSSWITEDDPNGYALTVLVPQALNEYRARAAALFSGENVYPRASAYEDILLTEDVYGDPVVVGNVVAEYEFSYETADADQLTVSEKERFMAAVRENVRAFLTEAARDGEISQAQLKSGIEAAGQAADNENIRFIVCENCSVDIY